MVGFDGPLEQRQLDGRTLIKYHVKLEEDKLDQAIAGALQEWEPSELSELSICNTHTQVSGEFDDDGVVVGDDDVPTETDLVDDVVRRTVETAVGERREEDSDVGSAQLHERERGERGEEETQEDDFEGPNYTESPESELDGDGGVAGDDDAMTETELDGGVGGRRWRQQWGQRWAAAMGERREDDYEGPNYTGSPELRFLCRRAFASGRALRLNY